MKSMPRSLIKIAGLNRRMIAVDRAQVVFLEEHEINNQLCTNIHFANTRWVTSSLTLDEVEALLSDDEHKESDERLKRWREQARERAEYQAEIDTITRSLMVTRKPSATRKEVNSDGSFKFVLEFEAPRSEEAEG
jgi:hypothetical protein